MASFGLKEYDFSVILAGVLRRYIYYMSEADIEEDIRNNPNELKLLQNISNNMSSILKSVSMVIHLLMMALN